MKPNKKYFVKCVGHLTRIERLRMAEQLITSAQQRLKGNVADYDARNYRRYKEIFSKVQVSKRCSNADLFVLYLFSDYDKYEVNHWVMNDKKQVWRNRSFSHTKRFISQRRESIYSNGVLMDRTFLDKMVKKNSIPAWAIKDQKSWDRWQIFKKQNAK